MADLTKLYAYTSRTTCRWLFLSPLLNAQKVPIAQQLSYICPITHILDVTGTFRFRDDI